MSILTQPPASLPRWDDLVAAEPRLERLAERARSLRTRSSRKKLGYWYDLLKPDLIYLVGWFGVGDLEGSLPYDVAYDYLTHHALGLLHCKGWCDACRAERVA